MNLIDTIVKYYSEREVPIVLTFMRYYRLSLPEAHAHYYTFRKNIQNSYWKIARDGWEMVMGRYKNDSWVYSCGSEGEGGNFLCSHCGNCLREYFATMERLQK